MQTILGSGGAIGSLLAKDLKNYTNKIRLVSRQPKKVNAGDELIAADPINAAETCNAIAGSEIVYLTAGLAYNKKIWQRDWPKIMQHVITACIKHKAKLVFFDNVYMYSKSSLACMTEDSAIDPPSVKGAVRAQLLEMLWKAASENGLQLLIARSADFYGPGATNGLLNIAVLEPYRKDKKAFWLCDASKIHSLTYTPDAAKAVALLGNTPGAYGQTWHLPTSSEKLTGRDYIHLAASIINTKPAYYILKKWMIAGIGIFSQTTAELLEMQYQNQSDYFFNSSKFEKTFGMNPTPYKVGIKATLGYM